MHHLDANKTAEEEARRQLHKNVASNIEQVLAATPHKAPTIRTPASHHENYPTIQVRWTRHAGHSWRSRDELIRDVLLWTPTYGRAKAGRPARTYIQQLCEDTGCSPEDLPEAMNDREKWQERVRDIHAGGTTWWWWWYHVTCFEWESWWYGHLPPISKTIQRSRTRHAGCCRRSKSELISDGLLWTPSHTDVQVLDDQLEPIYNSSVRTQDVV